MKNNFECKRCGKCCKGKEYLISIKATFKDIERWEKQNRLDISKYLEQEILDIESYESFGLIDFLIDPNTDEQLDECPFLEKVKDNYYVCNIHDTKPTFCRNYICENELIN